MNELGILIMLRKTSMRLLLTAAMAFSLLAGSATIAKADYFVWEDPKTGMSLSFPDTWDITNNQDPGDVVTVAAPSGRANSICSISSNEDKLYAIFAARIC